MSLGGWLESESRRSSLRKLARARHSVQKQIAPRFKLVPLIKRRILKIQARVNPRFNLCQIKIEIICAACTPTHLYCKAM